MAHNCPHGNPCSCDTLSLWERDCDDENCLCECEAEEDDDDEPEFDRYNRLVKPLNPAEEDRRDNPITALE